MNTLLLALIGVVVVLAVWMIYIEKSAPKKARTLIRRRLSTLISHASFEAMTFDEICHTIGANDLNHRQITFEELMQLVNEVSLVVTTNSHHPKRYYSKP